MKLCRCLVVSLSLLAVVLPAPAIGAADPSSELLDPAQAFRVSVHRVKSGALEIQFDIADGYYLYRDRFKLVVNGRETSKGELGWPKGLLVKDPNFGKVITFRNAVRLKPASLTPTRVGKVARVELDITSQGCADVGVCFPPLRQQVLITPDESLAVPSPALAEAPQASHISSPLANELLRKPQVR
jgi:thiol:disulfide interchange protein DsbD